MKKTLFKTSVCLKQNQIEYLTSKLIDQSKFIRLAVDEKIQRLENE